MNKPSDFAPWRNKYESVLDIRTSSESFGSPLSLPAGLGTGCLELAGLLLCLGFERDDVAGLGSILERLKISCFGSFFFDARWMERCRFSTGERCSRRRKRVVSRAAAARTRKLGPSISPSDGDLIATSDSEVVLERQHNKIREHAYHDSERNTGWMRCEGVAK